MKEVPTWEPPGEAVGKDGHDAVVNDLERGDVGKLFPRDEEEGVKELGKLAEEVDPGDSRHPHPVTVRIRAPIHIFTNWEKKRKNGKV